MRVMTLMKSLINEREKTIEQNKNIVEGVII